MNLLPTTCNRCKQGPDLHFVESKHTGESLFLCAECLGMWRIFDAAMTGGDEGYVPYFKYLREAGRFDHYLEDPTLESWNAEDWDKYNEPWINRDAEFNAQQRTIRPPK